MNWGNKLLLVFVGFGSMMSFMVYRCMQAPVNLVSKEYYNEEIAYQHVIDSKRQTNTLLGKVKLSQDDASIGITLPEDMRQKKHTGQITLYCPANAQHDRQFELHTDTAVYQSLSKKTVIPGSYIVKISWQADSVQYYAEEPLTIH